MQSATYSRGILRLGCLGSVGVLVGVLRFCFPVRVGRQDRVVAGIGGIRFVFIGASCLSYSIMLRPRVPFFCFCVGHLGSLPPSSQVLGFIDSLRFSSLSLAPLPSLTPLS